MSGGIFILQDDGHLLELSEQAYDSDTATPCRCGPPSARH